MTHENSARRHLRAIRADDTAELEPYLPDEAVSTVDSTGKELATPESTGDVVPVDPPKRAVTIYGTAISARVADRRPLVPGWVVSRHDRRTVTRWAAGHTGHTIGYHLLRAPLYALRTAYRAPLGVLVSLRLLAGWIFDAEGRLLRHEAVIANDPKAYLRLSEQRADRVRLRGVVAIVLGVLALVAVVVASRRLPGWALLVAGGVAALVLAWVGSPKDKPLVGHAVIATEVAKLTGDMVLAALGSLGLAELNKVFAPKFVGPGITFPSPITRDGPGWRADVDLPLGVTALDIVERREKLASGLRRPTGAVWPEPDPTSHAGRMILWVGDRPMSQARQPAWPLAKTGAADLFKPIPFGFDQRGRLVTIPLMYSNLLVGAIPRQGKSFSVRVVALTAALDPNVELHCHELKGTADHQAVEPCSHRYTSGPPAEDTLRSVMDSVSEVHGYLDSRARTIGGLPQAVVPENKATPELAAKRSLKLWPVVLIVDECQELFESEYGGAAETMLKAIIKRGPALGIMLVLATQRPDKDALPTGISSSMGARLCLRVMGQIENDMILGTSAYKNGMRATTLTDEDKGVGYLRDGGAARVVRSAYIDGPAAERIGKRARALREAAGTLTGYAAGDDLVSVEVNVVQDVRSCFGGDETGLWNETLLARLLEHRPGRYQGWTAAQLTGALKAKGVAGAGRQVERLDPETNKRVNRRGVFLVDLPAALPVAPTDGQDGTDDGPAGPS